MATSPEADDLLVEQVRTRWGAAVSENTVPTLTIKSRRAPPPTETLSHVHPAPRRLTTAPDTPEAAEGDFSLLRIIGEGGMGVVYSARQTSLNREIAIKILQTSGTPSSDVAAKFLAEAAVTGELEHPNIIPVYDVGCTPEGTLFYAMREITGTSWEKVISTLSLEENLRILLSVCDAVAFAHSRGILHRDLKPENVMLGEFGEVYVTDWGLAVSLAPGHRQSLAHETGLAGTPSYMAPEMAACEFDRLGPATDVYLLGGILYQIATGLRPHTGQNVYDCIAAALRNELQATEQRGELVEIARRAMATRPDDRYPDVRSFQAAIRTYQAHAESARLSESADERIRLWPSVEADSRYREANEIIASYQQALKLWPDNTSAARGLRHARTQLVELALERGDLALAVSERSALEADVRAYPLRDDDASVRQELGQRVATAVKKAARRRRIVLASIVMSIMATGVTLAAVGWAYVTTRQERDRALQAEQATRLALTREAEARARAVDQQREAERQREEARRQQELAEHHRAIAEARQAELQKTLHRVEEEHYRNVVTLAVRRLDEGRPDLVQEILWSVASDARAWEWGYLLAESMPQLQSLAGHAGAVLSVAFSPDGDRLVTSGLDKRVILWDWAPGQVDVSLLTGSLVVLAAAIHSDGRSLVAMTAHGHLIVLDPNTRRQTEDRVLAPWPAAVEAANFSPLGEWVLVRDREGILRVWDTRTTRCTGEFPLPADAAVCEAAAIAADGRLVAVAIRTRGMDIWDLSQGRRINTFPLEGHRAGLLSLAWSPDGQRLLTGSRDGSARVWDVFSGRCLAVLRGHTAPVSAVAFSAGGQLLATGSHDHQVSVWDALSLGAWMTLQAHSNALIRLACLRDGRALVTAAEQEGWSVWDLDTGRPGNDPPLVRCPLRAVAVSLDGNRILGGTREGALVLWERQVAGTSPSVVFPFEPVEAVALGPGARFAMVAGRTHVTVWSVEDRRVLARAERSETGPPCVAVSPDGEWTAYGGFGLTLWRFPSLREATDLPWEGGTPQGLTFSPDSRHLLAWGRGGATVYDVVTRHVVYRLGATASGVASACYTPDGRRIATGGLGRIGIWDADAGRELLTFSVPTGWVTALAFSPDGHSLWAGAEDGTVRLWRAFDPAVSKGDLPREAARRLMLWRQRQMVQ